MSHAPSNNSHWRAAVAVVALATLARELYVGLLCGIPLIEDEAFYWEWSLRPALSYYTKGPGIAWLIRAATEVLGTSEFAVRAAAPICGAVVALCVGWMARRAAGNRAGLYAVVCVLCAPMLQATSMLMTIDGPYAACWALACVGAMHALLARGRWAWLLCGAAIGVGFLFKYTIVFLPISLLVFCIWRRADLGLAARWRAWAIGAIVLALLGTGPVLIWNSQQGWPTVAHLLGHLGVRGGDMPVTQGEGGWHYSVRWTAFYVAGQFGLVGPALALSALCAWASFKGRGGAATLAARRFFACGAVPLFAFYFVVSFITEPEGNWSLAASITACALAGVAFDDSLVRWRERVGAWRALPEPRPKAGLFMRRPQSLALGLWIATLVVGLGGAAVLPVVDLFGARAGGLVPAARISGAREMAAHVDRLCAELGARGAGAPMVIAMHYGRAAQLRFYMKGHPIVYCSGRTLGHGRTTQYDFWKDTNLLDPALRSRPAVVIGGTRESWLPFFTEVGEPFTLDGDLKKGRPAFIARGYIGCPVDRAAGTPSK